MWSGSATPGQSTVCSGNSGRFITRTARKRAPETQKPPGSPDGFIVSRDPQLGPAISGSSSRGLPASSAVRKLEPQPQPRHGVRVVDGEARAHQRVDVVDLGALQELDALAVDVHLDAVRLERRSSGDGASSSIIP